MAAFLWIVLNIALSMLYGVIVVKVFDTHDRVFWNWLKRDPTKGFFSGLLLICWPVMVALMLRYYGRRG